MLVLLAVGFGNFSQWCSADGHICNRTVLDRMIPYVTYPLYFFSLYLLPLALILIFVPKTVFKSWLKLAVWAVPLLLIFISTQPVYPQHILSTDRDDTARLAAEILTVLSFILIAWKYYTSRRANPVKA